MIKNIKKEIWKPVVGYEGLYEISSYGKIKSLGRTTTIRTGCYRIEIEKIMKTNQDNHGYYYCALAKNGKRIKWKAHRLVAIAFHGFKRGLQVNHIDGDKTNNHIENLEWVTASENVKHSFKLGKKFTREMAQHASSFSVKVCARKIWMCTLTGKKIKLFPSISEARRAVGGNISSVLEGRCTHCKGYKFMYASEQRAEVQKLREQGKENYISNK